MFKILLASILIFNISGFKNINEEFYTLEKKVITNTQFVENGVKIQYREETTVEKEIKEIEKIFKKRYEIVERDEGVLKLKGKFDINFSVWKEGKMVYVEGTIINRDNTFKSSKEIKEEFRELFLKNKNNFEFFEFYKGKLIENKKLNEIKTNGNFIKIKNGFTGKVKMKRGTELNVGITEYKSGTYVTIGTPIIFTTY